MGRPGRFFLTKKWVQNLVTLSLYVGTPMVLSGSRTHVPVVVVVEGAVVDHGGDVGMVVVVGPVVVAVGVSNDGQPCHKGKYTK